MFAYVYLKQENLEEKEHALSLGLDSLGGDIFRKGTKAGFPLMFYFLREKIKRERERSQLLPDE